MTMSNKQGLTQSSNNEVRLVPLSIQELKELQTTLCIEYTVLLELANEDSDWKLPLSQCENFLNKVRKAILTETEIGSEKSE